MFSSIFKKRPAPKHEPVFIFVHLNAKLMPIERGERFEDPLDKQLKKAGYGEVTGAGTGQEPKTGEIAFSGIDVELTDLDAGIPFLTQALEKLGAPKGSRLEFSRNGQDIKHPFGLLEGVGIYLNGTDLPPEVYQTSDINKVIDRVQAAIKGKGTAQDFWEGPTETALYLYGPSADAMLAAIKPVLDSEPLCQKARTVRIA